MMHQVGVVLLLCCLTLVLGRERGYRRQRLVQRDLQEPDTDNVFLVGLHDGPGPNGPNNDGPNGKDGKGDKNIYSFQDLPSGKSGKSGPPKEYGPYGKAGKGDKKEPKVPTVSPAPSTSMKPTRTANPTPAPSLSFEPTQTRAPSPSPSVTTSPSSSPSKLPSIRPTPVPQPTDPPTLPPGNIPCSSVPEGGCSVCGEGQCVVNPDALFAYPGQPSTACGELQNAGFNGLITVDQCPYLSDLIKEDCQCQEYIPAPPPASTPCPSVPADGCSICGAGLCATNPDAVFAYPGQPVVPCGVLEMAGLEGRVPLSQCGLLPPLVDSTCGCNAYIPGSLSPTMSPTTTLKRLGVDCDAIGKGTATTDAPYVSFIVSQELTISNDYDFSEVANEINGILQTRVAPRVAGCPDASVITGSRLLQTEDDTQIVNVLFAPTEPNSGETCDSAIEGATCFPSSTPVDIYYDGDDTAGFLQRLLDALNELGLQGAFAGYGNSVAGPFVVTEDGGSGGGVVGAIGQDEEDDTTLAVGALAAIGLAGVALVALLLLFFVGRSRRNRGQEVKHIYLEDYDDHFLDGTQDGTNRSSEGNDSPEKRMTHIVGEDDSVQSGWTGYTQEKGGVHGGDILSDLHDFEHDRGFEEGLDGKTYFNDVHQCSSATCETCRMSRQRPMFLQTGNAPPLPPRLPKTARRAYVAADTVEL